MIQCSQQNNFENLSFCQSKLEELYVQGMDLHQSQQIIIVDIERDEYSCLSLPHNAWNFTSTWLGYEHPMTYTGSGSAIVFIHNLYYPGSTNLYQIVQCLHTRSWLFSFNILVVLLHPKCTYSGLQMIVTSHQQ